LENDRKCKIEYPFIPTPKNLTAKSIDSASCKSNGTLDGDVFKGNAFQVEFLSDGIRDSIVFAYGNFGDNRPSASGTSIRPDAYWDFADGERWEDNSSRRYNWHKVRENTNRQSIIKKHEDAKELDYQNKVNAFRKQVQSGDDTTSGVVIEVKGNLVKIQTEESKCTQRDYQGGCQNYISSPVEKWFKKTDIYPPR
jgi:hypothetical protein